VHKTVYEYFTAVKLYEDSFADYDSDYFNKIDNYDLMAKEVMESYVEAFRYANKKGDVFKYLCEMDGEPFATTLESLS
jgi:hypothetical protein